MAAKRSSASESTHIVAISQPQACKDGGLKTSISLDGVIKNFGHLLHCCLVPLRRPLQHVIQKLEVPLDRIAKSGW